MVNLGFLMSTAEMIRREELRCDQLERPECCGEQMQIVDDTTIVCVWCDRVEPLPRLYVGRIRID